MTQLDFYFDFISPYAYVAWSEVTVLAKRHSCTLHAIPVLFGALLDAHGNIGPAEVRAKRAYVFKDAYRKAHKAGLSPLTPPPSHPFNPLFALRAVASANNEMEREALVSILFRATWGGGSGVDSLALVEEIASAHGLDGKAIAARAATTEAKDALRTSTTHAIELGVFGVPTMMVRGELFWGVDSLPHLDDFLGGKDPLPADLLSRWASLPATATRPRSMAR